MKKKLALCAVLLVLALGALAGDKKSGQVSDLKFTVVKAENGKPVRNASVILHAVDEKGRQERSGLQLKTDEEGKTSFDAVPYGKMRVQVIAPGFQTFGQDYQINQPTDEIVIQLRRPQQQYSIYK